MGELSRSSSRQLLLQPDESASFTSFPDPSTANQSQESESHAMPLNGLLDRSGPSMFDEKDIGTKLDVQALSAAPAGVVQEVIDHHGAVKLVKRLATLLAERDAHISALKRLAEAYSAPPDKIAETASRVKEAENTRLLLSTAAQDTVSQDGERSADNVSTSTPRVIDATTGGTFRGLTKMFGGAGKRREGDISTPTSSRSTSRPPQNRERLQSIDAQSLKSVNTTQSTDIGLMTTLLSNSFGTSSKRHDSTTSREPVELKTQHDREQMPPTLSDRFQDPNEIEWNRYLLKLTEARTQNGEQLNGGELIGAAHFGQEGVAGQKKMKALIQLILGGIPMTLRQLVWMELSNARKVEQPGAYQHLLNLRETSDQSDIEAILKDVPRTLTSKYDFFPGNGYQKLKEVLVAFVARYEDLGYTQGLNTIAGYLLLAIPSAEEAFWLLCNMVENFFPSEYFSRKANMSGPLADNKVLRQYVKDCLPQLAKRLDELQITADHTVPLNWFFTAFSTIMPQDTLMRIWDVWLCMSNQKTFIFNIALALLAQNASGLMDCRDDGEYFAYLSRLEMPEEAEKVDELIKQAFAMRRRLDPEQVEHRRSLEFKVMRRKRDSTEALYSPQ